MTTAFWCEHAWLGGPTATDSVRIEIGAGKIVAVLPGSPAGDALRLYGLTLPGFANTHSHAFHRVLRGTTQDVTGDFWSWRQAMYEAAAGLDPDSYGEIAEIVFREMLRAGYTVVGEFHYLHHDPGGGRYTDPNVMGTALIEAAQRVGIRLTLLDTLYQHGGIGSDGRYQPAEGAQRRFIETPTEWQSRLDELASSTGDMARIGAAIHSVRTVDRDGIRTVAGWAQRNGAPLHAHVSEQPQENEQSEAAHGATPTAALTAHGAVGHRFTAVHGTHLAGDDIALLAAAPATVCLCPTTERDLADGVGPSAALVAAGARLAIGSDSQAVVDPFEEARAIELNQRLVTSRRGTHRPHELLTAATENGYAALGWPEGGAIREGALADLVTVRLNGPRMGGATQPHLLGAAVFAAHPEDVTSVVVGGVQHDYA